MDKNLMIGAADLGWKPTVGQVVKDLEVVLGFKLSQTPSAEDMFLGGDDSARAWLTWEPDDREPFESHPFVLDIATSQPEVAYVTALFDRLADLGRYRVILLIDHACFRSTHFPCDQW
ncbi:hypothetical protein ACFOW4_13250 [Micromonospora sp. GCM10011542]|uniref:hypothetical protein n=1 Tax=Micromonospora sp. GCM10011542 TaxID=3317337 RepID=UPI00360D72A6